MLDPLFNCLGYKVRVRGERFLFVAERYLLPAFGRLLRAGRALDATFRGSALLLEAACAERSPYGGQLSVRPFERPTHITRSHMYLYIHMYEKSSPYLPRQIPRFSLPLLPTHPNLAKASGILTAANTKYRKRNKQIKKKTIHKKKK